MFLSPRLNECRLRSARRQVKSDEVPIGHTVQPDCRVPQPVSGASRSVKSLSLPEDDASVQSAQVLLQAADRVLDAALPSSWTACSSFKRSVRARSGGLSKSVLTLNEVSERMSNAVRHGWWESLLTFTVGPQVAQDPGDTHERSPPYDCDSAMDQLNNAHAGSLVAVIPFTCPNPGPQP